MYGEAHASAPRLPAGPSLRPRRRRLELASVLSGTGRVLIALGLLILGFVAFELLGTNVAESRDQTELQEQLTVPPPPVDLQTSQPVAPQPGQQPDQGPPPPPSGSAVARIRIPRIGLDKAVIEGVDLSDLRRGPGHYSTTPLPGQPGNSAIAGHRTTYGAPFFRLDKMEPGDPILVSTVQGAFLYEVRRVFVVKPSQIDVLDPTEGSQLTLTTCNPRFSAAERLVVVADLKGPAAPASPPRPAEPPANIDPPSIGADPSPVETTEPEPVAQEVVGASGDPAERIPSALWGSVVLLLMLVGAALGRLWRKWPARLVVAAPFLVCLWTFYSHLARAVPS
ncbi:MAG: class E sortase [Acidimicrobiales bacterium]